MFILHKRAKIAIFLGYHDWIGLGLAFGDPIFFLHESTRGVELRLHTENQGPR